MKIGIMQPYFFPYIGYFSLIAAVDKWVVFDSSQYTKKSWISRNRVANNVGDWSYINLPVINNGLDMTISSAVVSDPDKAKQKLLNQLQQYAKYSDYYDDVITLIRNALYKDSSNKLVDLNINTISAICHYLNIPFNYEISSNLDIDYNNVTGSGEWALEIAKYFNASEYINPISGRHLFDAEKFNSNNIQLSFHTAPTMTYTCRAPFNYISNLSIVDALMWCPVEQVVDVINQHTTRN